MFVRTPRRQLDDDAIEHLLAEVFASVKDPEPIDAELTETEAQAILNGYELAMGRFDRECLLAPIHMQASLDSGCRIASFYPGPTSWVRWRAAGQRARV